MANLVVSSIPSAIAVISKDGTIVDANPGFQALVKKSPKELVGMDFETVLPAEISSQVRNVKEGKLFRGTAQVPQGFFELTIFVEPTQSLKILILTDKTEEKVQREHIEAMRRETLERVEKVVKKQMEVAQKIAGLLGETTAETKGSLSQLVKILRKEE